MLGGERRKGEHCGMIDVHGRAQTITEDKDEKIASTLEIHIYAVVADKRFAKKFTPPQFVGKNLHKKWSVYHNIFKFAAK